MMKLFYICLLSILFFPFHLLGQTNTDSLKSISTSPYQEPKSIDGGVFVLEKDGIWRSYYSNGIVESEGRFNSTFKFLRKDFKKNGVWFYFNVEGELIKTIEYKKGMPIRTSDMGVFKKVCHSNFTVQSPGAVGGRGLDDKIIKFIGTRHTSFRIYPKVPVGLFSS